MEGMPINLFDEALRGGHPNSLGNTVEVVEQVLNDADLLDDLFDCYRSDDPVVRLRVSSAIKRVAKEHPEWVATHLDDLLGWVAEIDQASTKWTLSTIYVWLEVFMSSEQKQRAIEIMKHNLRYDDWIVQNTTAESLAHYARELPALALWLRPELEKLEKSRHKSVAGRARKLIVSLYGGSAGPATPS